MSHEHSSMSETILDRSRDCLDLPWQAVGMAGAALNRLLGPRSGLGILTYHRVTPVVPGLPKPLHNVTPDTFRRQLTGLLERGFAFWSLSRLLDAAEEGADPPPKTVVVTFDDGYASVLTEAWPVLKDLGIPATLSVWLGQRSAAESHEVRVDSVVVVALGKSEGTVRERATAIVETLRSAFDAPLVAIGWKSKATASAEVLSLAVDATHRVDSDARSVLGEVVDEALLHDEGAVWTLGAERERPALLKHARLGGLLDFAWVASVSLTDERGDVRGVLLHAGCDGDIEGIWGNQRDRIGCVLGRHLDLASRAKPTFLVRSLDSLRRAPWRAWAVAAAAILLLLLWPISHSVSCKCTIEPVRRRYVAAPFDGVLARVHARPGDAVVAGQLLAEMDGREVQLALSERDADYHRARQQQRIHAASQEFADARVAALEMERIDAERELLRGRLQQLRITSSLDGIVLEGEFDKAEGVRLDKGQSLFEIGPLDRMVVEVEIPASEITYVREDGEVVVRLDNGGGAELSGRLTRIRPRSEVRADEHIFVAELEIENPDGTLRPGTSGRAAIREATRPLGWVLFHRAWDRVRLGWIGWWS